MRWLAVPLLVVSCLAIASRGCELQVLYESAIDCSQSGRVLNITKYVQYIDQLVTDGSPPPGSYDPPNVEAFLRNHTFSEMAQMFGELEPTIVWMLDSFYQDHLASLTEEDFLRPLFGDMSMIRQLLNSSLISHCAIMNQMGSCMNRKMMDKCSGSDALKLKTQIVDPLLNRFCSGQAVKTQAIQWLSSHSTNMTSAFSCFVDRSNLPTRLDLRNLETDPLILTTNFPHLIAKCNMMGVGTPIVRWYNENMADLFGTNFDLMKFNIVELLDRNIPMQFLRLIGPLGKCVVYEFKPFLKNLCPKIDVDAEISKAKDMLAYVMPMFLSAQEYAFNIVESPEAPPDLSDKNRHSIALLGSSHIYSLELEEWVASCPPSTMHGVLLFSIGDYSAIRMSDRSIHMNKLLFNNTGIYVSSYTLLPQTLYVPLSKLPPEELQFYLNLPLDVIDTDGKTHFSFHYPQYGTFVSVQNPTGENWVVFMRAAIGWNQLDYGVFAKGCGPDGGFMAAVREEAASAPEMCTSKCSQAAVLSDACAYDCVTSNLNGLTDEITALRDFNKKAARSDRNARNMAINQHGGSHAPCSAVGLVSNVGVMCAYRAILSGLMPSFNLSSPSLTTIIGDIGVIEPYILYAVAAFFKEFVVGPPPKPFQGNSPVDYISFVSDSMLLTTMEKHCRLMGPFTQCLAEGIPDYCRPSGQSFVEKYLTRLPDRYCTGVNSDVPRVNQQVFNAMISARDDLLDEMSCVVNSTNDVLSFDMERLMRIYKVLEDRCNFDLLVSYVMDMVTSFDGNILDEVLRLVRIAQNPVRCALKVIPTLCAGMNPETLADKLVMHLNRMTASSFNFTREWFIDTKVIHYGSRQRVTMLAVGDPHIRHLDATSFSMCESPGLQTYFSNSKPLRVELKGLNNPARLNTNATVIRSVSLHVWATDASIEDEPALKYEASNGDLPMTFSNNETYVTVGAFPISIHSLGSNKVLIRNRQAGLIIAVVKFKDFYNLIVRMARGYAETGTGHLITGCNLQAKNVTELNQAAAQDDARRRRAVTVEECTAACVNVPELLAQECLFDCVVTEDTSIADAHIDSVGAEEEVEEEDEEIFELLGTATTTQPPATKRQPPVSSSCTPSLTSALLILSALNLLG